MSPAVLQEHREFLAAMEMEVTERDRRIIIETKVSLLTEEGRTSSLSGYHIYQAVLNHGLSEKDDIVDYLRQHDVEVSGTNTARISQRGSLFF